MGLSKNELKSVMARVWDIDMATIPDDVALGGFRAWDSLGHVALLTELEKLYGLELNEDSIIGLSNIEKILIILNS